MTWIFSIILRLPAWFILILAGGVFYGGTQVINLLDVDNRALEAAARLEPAQLVDFDPEAIIPPGEVALRTKVFDDASYHFFYQDDGTEDYVEYFFFMEAPEATATDRVFSGVLVFESNNRAKVEAWWKSVLINPENDNDLAAIQGYAAEADVLSYEASEALYALGGTASENFMFIRPFLEGRDAFYAQKILPLDMIRYGLWLLVGVLVAWAVIRHTIGRRAKAAAAVVASNPAKAALGVGGAAVGLMGFGDEDDEDFEEDDEEGGEYGLALSIGKVLFGFLWKRRAAKKVAQEQEVEQDVEPEVTAAPALAQQAYQPMRSEQVMYKAHRQLYDEDGLPITI